jgi:hypothetical protein
LVLSDDHKYFFEQPRRRRKRRYFKYDAHFWVKGAEGSLLRKRYVRILQTHKVPKVLSRYGEFSELVETAKYSCSQLTAHTPSEGSDTVE